MREKAHLKADGFWRLVSESGISQSGLVGFEPFVQAEIFEIHTCFFPEEFSHLAGREPAEKGEAAEVEFGIPMGGVVFKPGKGPVIGIDLGPGILRVEGVELFFGGVGHPEDILGPPAGQPEQHGGEGEVAEVGESLYAIEVPAQEIVDHEVHDDIRSIHDCQDEEKFEGPLQPDGLAVLPEMAFSARHRLFVFHIPVRQGQVGEEKNDGSYSFEGLEERGDEVVPHLFLAIGPTGKEDPVKRGLGQGQDKVLGVGEPEFVSRVEREFYGKEQERSQAPGIPDRHEIFFLVGVKNPGVDQQIIEYAKRKEREQQAKLDIGLPVPPPAQEKHPPQSPSGQYGKHQN